MAGSMIGLVPDEMPPGAEIMNPEKSGWVVERDGQTEQVGTLWNGQYCDYCPYMDLCAMTPPGRQPVIYVQEIAEAAGLA